MKNILAVYNGSFDFLDKIKISPLSRAYTFSDSVYEVIPFYNSKIIAFDEHIARLEKSCEALSFSIKILDISNEILELITKSKVQHGYIYYQVTRGIDNLRSHMFDKDISIETFGYAVELSLIHI